MSHKYRAAIGHESRRPASRGIWLKLNRGVEIARGNFTCREMASGKSNFCILLFAYKSMWLPGIRQKGAAGSSADKLLRKYAAQ